MGPDVLIGLSGEAHESLASVSLVFGPYGNIIPGSWAGPTDDRHGLSAASFR
jgi:hypothetical protein